MSRICRANGSVLAGLGVVWQIEGAYLGASPGVRA